ncbi:FAD binding domain-containing protein [Colletotrichum kahawae]|uniref:FAD binding domain-containing protein n=1 Tax=Colletotrichum kahawae TaxID=34407 RepID=A0AAD9Y1Y6_COLKA|nr:FAD binding domain-containing protein [Colletotrichum kahawae]
MTAVAPTTLQPRAEAGRILESATLLPEAKECQLIESEMPNRVAYPETPTYNESISSYYSGQERDIRPGCIFQPENADEVSQFIKLITGKDTTCSHASPKFAIRSGGHMIWPGSANIDQGITVDLRKLNSFALNEDKTLASLGVGGIWSDIYPRLVHHNLTVMGGRVTGIGVGGLATGGGIHYLARRHGWVCDNIHTYQIVLPSGAIVEATASSHEDLWLALKGGSNSFGIVTRIDVPTFPMGDMWGGSVAFEYTQEVLDAHAQAFSDFMSVENFDDAADMGMSLLFDQGNYAVGDALYYVYGGTGETSGSE